MGRYKIVEAFATQGGEAEQRVRVRVCRLHWNQHETSVWMG